MRAAPSECQTWWLWFDHGEVDGGLPVHRVRLADTEVDRPVR
jgi:hypothetical protein